MRESDSIKPAIFAMSNPTTNGLSLDLLGASCYTFLCDSEEIVVSIFGAAECTARDAFKHAGEQLVFGSGSPFEHVDLSITLLILSWNKVLVMHPICFQFFWQMHFKQ